jgi:hypothetical protein
MHLSSYIIGPLGRFYNFPNRISAFQYINHEHILSLGGRLADAADKITTLSINNEFSKPILNFYFRNRSILSCELDYSLDARAPSLAQCKNIKAHAHRI